MKKVCYVTLGAMVIILCAASMACAGWIDTFDTYSSQAEVDAVWAPMSSSTTLTWSTDQSFSPTHSVMTDGGETTRQGTYRSIGELVTYATLDFSFKFYDTMGTTVAGGRSMAMVWSRTGNLWTGTVTNSLGIGRNNTITTTKYTGRMAFGGVGTTGGFFALTGAADRSVGWHTAQIKGNPATGNIEYWIDGLLGATQSYGTRQERFSLISLGMGLPSSAVPLYYDDVSINAPVPEPGSMVAAMSLLAPVGLMIRRRRT